jgi:hypothetical protein
VQAWQHAQPSGTNRPRGLISPARLLPDCRHEHRHTQCRQTKTIPITRTFRQTGRRSMRHEGSRSPKLGHRGPPPTRFWPAIIARGPHPFPSRTRSLSLAARMVLPGRPGGRVRRRRPILRKPRQSARPGALLHPRTSHSRRARHSRARGPHTRARTQRMNGSRETRRTESREEAGGFTVPVESRRGSYLLLTTKSGRRCDGPAGLPRGNTPLSPRRRRLLRKSVP